jgi:muramoyltetrapeptide carboxypeptidase LdcA involved in peptidoglycan recycling
MSNITPAKLKVGDKVRVISPARSLKLISQDSRENAKKAFEQIGLTLEFGKNTELADEFLSSPVEKRLEDLHDAYTDKSVNGIITVIGGFNANQLLRGVNWELIRSNPKVFCGYSIITALTTAINTKTNQVTYYGPHYSTFGQKKFLEYTTDYFKKCLMSNDPFNIQPSQEWTDDAWYMDQDNRNPIPNKGWTFINNGTAEGQIVGGNANTFALLNGTEYFPSLSDKILFLEDDELVNAVIFDSVLQSLILRYDFSKVRGLVIGRFQKESNIDSETLVKIITSKPELSTIPVICDVDFGHTEPKVTLPIGGIAKIECSQEFKKGTITIVTH